MTPAAADMTLKELFFIYIDINSSSPPTYECYDGADAHEAQAEVEQNVAVARVRLALLLLWLETIFVQRMRNGLINKDLCQGSDNNI